MKIIDSHVHMGLHEFCIDDNFGLAGNIEMSCEEYLKEMNMAGVDEACIIPIPYEGYDIKKSNEYIITVASETSGKFHPICRMDEMLSNNLASSFVAAKYHKVYEEIGSRKLREYFRFLEYNNKPLIVHAAFKNKVRQVKEIMKVAPRLKIVLAHMGRGHLYTNEGIEENLEALKKYENVFFETSTIGDYQIVQKACNLVGSERIMFGSDYPFGKIFFSRMGIAYSYKEEVQNIMNLSALSDKQRDDIFFGTATRVYLSNYSPRERIVVRYTKKYKKGLENLLDSFSNEDRVFLAFDSKRNIIKDCIRKENHIYILLKENEVVGYLRESGRNEGYTMLEELAIKPDCRGYGYASDLLDFYILMFEKSYAKTNSRNIIMNHLLMKKGFKYTSGERILKWKYT